MVFLLQFQYHRKHQCYKLTPMPLGVGRNWKAWDQEKEDELSALYYIREKHLKNYVYGSHFVVCCCCLVMVDFTHTPQGYFTGACARVQWMHLKHLGYFTGADCPNTIEATLNNLDKCFKYIHWTLTEGQKGKAQHNKTRHIFYGI